MLGESREGVSIRFVDVSKEAPRVDYNVGSYFTVVTNYRLLLFSDMFQEYDRMIYLDCDMIINSDISKLYYTDLKGNPIGAVEDMGFRMLRYTKKAVFIDGKHPYNVDNYRTDALKMKHPEDYFNAGMLLLDLKSVESASTMSKYYKRYIVRIFNLMIKIQ